MAIACIELPTADEILRIALDCTSSTELEHIGHILSQDQAGRALSPGSLAAYINEAWQELEDADIHIGDFHIRALVSELITHGKISIPQELSDEGYDANKLLEDVMKHIKLSSPAPA